MRLRDDWLHSALQFNYSLNPLNELWRTEPELPFVEWMDAYCKLSSESSAVPSDWSTRSFQRGPSYAMADLDIPVFVECAPSQVGKTKRLLFYKAYSLVVRMRNVGFWLPDTKLLDDYVDTQVDGMLRDCPEIAKRLLGEVDMPSQYNTKIKKMFLGAVLFLRSAQSAQGFRSITLDDAILDDLDGMPRVLTENKLSVGTPRTRAWNRTRTSDARKLLMASTPTEWGNSPIWDAYLSCAARFLRYIPCLKCGFHQPLNFNHEPDSEAGGVTYTLGKTIGESADSARFVCAHCKHASDYTDLREMDENGYWESGNGLQQKDSTGEFHPVNKRGKPHLRALKAHEKPHDTGYNYTALFSYEEDWASTVRFYLEAQQNYTQRRDDSELVVFDNEYLGRPSKRRTGTISTANSLVKRCNTPYDYQCPLEVQFITAGVDVQRYYFDYEIVGWGDEWRSFSLDTGSIDVDATAPEHPGWDVLRQLRMSRYARADESVGINLMLIDARFLPDNVKRFCAEMPYNCIAAQGQPRGDAQMLSLSKHMGAEGCRIARVGTVLATERVYQMLEVETPGPGYCDFPHYEGKYFEVDDETGEITSDFFDQLTAEQILVSKKTGRRVTEPRDRQRNEKHDDRKLAMVGMEALLRSGHAFTQHARWMEVQLSQLQNVSEKTDDTDPYSIGHRLGST